MKKEDDLDPRVEPSVPCVEATGSTAEESLSAVTAAERPDVWSYEGEKHGRHDVSICLGGMEENAPHECYANTHGKTAEAAHARARRIVEALAALQPEGWRDIESAPKDGKTVVLLTDLLSVWTGYFDEHWWPVWVSAPDPTHWMPLPALPRPCRRNKEKTTKG